MTINGWIMFIIISILFIAFGIFIAYMFYDDNNIVGTIITIVILVGVIFGLYFGMHWYYTNTASGQRALVDQKSELNSGIERVINVYTADGNLIATYEGKIDIDTNDGGYVKFDFNGKRYIYYNCFVETIADIN